MGFAGPLMSLITALKRTVKFIESTGAWDNFRDSRIF
jgi:hypothetical protein